MADNDVFRRWPRVKAIVYFDVDMTKRNKRHPRLAAALPIGRIRAGRPTPVLAAMPRFKGTIGRTPAVPAPEPPPEEFSLDPPPEPPGVPALVPTADEGS